MRMPMLAVLALVASSFAAPAARAYYEAPWSSFDFLTDQRWSQINNRLIDQNLEFMNDAIAGQIEERGAARRKSALDLGEDASTDLAPLRPYLAQNQLTEENAAKLLAMYRLVAMALDVPANDSASGMAAFLAGTYAASTNEPFPDEFFKPLYEQFAKSMTSDDALAQRSKAERLEYYQRQVVVGMVFQLLQLELQKSGSPEQIAEMRAAAGRAFEDLAGRSPDSIRFTAQGLTPR